MRVWNRRPAPVRKPHFNDDCSRSEFEQRPSVISTPIPTRTWPPPAVSVAAQFAAQYAERMRFRHSHCLLPTAILLLLPISIRSDTAKPTDSAELMQIYEADQKDRKAQLGGVDWKVVGPRDTGRRKRVRELIDKGVVRTGKDYERAAMVFQHGDTPEDILFAHVLAVAALGKGNAEARWLAAASLDRYLHRLGQPQVFGTQFTNKDVSTNEGWTMEPYNRQLLAPSLLDVNCVPDRDHQSQMLNAVRRGEEPPAPKHQPCAESSGK